VPRPFRARYAAEALSSTRARHAATGYYGDLLPRRTRHDLGLIVSELVTNAVRHGAGDIDLLLDVQDGRIRGEVIDQGDGFAAALREASPDDLGGRGLVIVDHLAQEWGVYDGSSHVWFHLPLDGAAPQDGRPPETRPPDPEALPDA
jgi:two-component sensor histidine kinase